MNWRLVSIGLVLAALVVSDGALLLMEDIVPPDRPTTADELKQDPLFGMQFVAGDRETNLQRMGFAPDEVKDALAKIKGLADRYRVAEPEFNQVQNRIEESSDPDSLVSALCGTGSTMPVRYAALQFLVTEKGNQLKAVDVDEIGSFELQDWSKRARIQPVYEEAELTKDRHEDATRMALAAILTGQEDTLLKHTSPWGQDAFFGWSWEKVQAKHAGIRPILIEYVALMHLVLEVANREGGLCAT